MIGQTVARLLVRECAYKPMRGKVLTLGRQTIALTYREVMGLFHQEGYTPSSEVLEGMEMTHDQKTRAGKGTDYIIDADFMRLLGAEELVAMDVSAYESADILHNLNEPVPSSLYDQFDFIIDGGVFDHLFNIRLAFENIVRMLKTGGRVFQANACSNLNGLAYVSFGANLFYDYYVLNQFADCKVYVAELDNCAQMEAWDFYEFMGYDRYAHFQSNRIQYVVVLAEKGQSSSWDKMPVQDCYRDAELWEPYRVSQKTIQSSRRPSFMGSRSVYKLAIPKDPIPLLLLKLREEGVVWFFKKAVSLLSENVHHLIRGKKLRGYIYRGKI